mgnify:FL=1|jgi:hypothetical protein|nr:MAG TPA: hypothetical protein [Caudoviricetes sp.]
MKMSKTAQGVQKLKDGDLKGALSIFSTFKYDFTRDERRTMRIAYESLCGHGTFYQSLGIDASQMIADAVTILYDKYLNSNKLN